MTPASKAVSAALAKAGITDTAKPAKSRDKKVTSLTITSKTPSTSKSSRCSPTSTSR